MRHLLSTTLVVFLLASATAQSGCTIGSGTSKPAHPTLADGAPAVECSTVADCQVTDTSCATPACTNGICAFTYAPEGTVSANQTPGDCRQTQCDGSGGVVQAPLDSDVPEQVDGDCRKKTCSNGSEVDVVDDSDLPNVASNPCTTNLCVNGTPSAPPKPAGTLCSNATSGRYCNAGGTCIYCAPLDAACDDPGPATSANDTEATAYDSGSVGNDDGEGKEVCGAFKSDGAVEWYHYEGDTETVLFGSPYENDPAGAVVSDVDVTLCIYMTCTEGPTADFVCPSGTTVATSPAGHDGCCLTGKNPGMDIRHVCANAGVWMSVTATDATTCDGYDFSFHY
jgi:hypothetical protein